MRHSRHQLPVLCVAFLWCASAPRSALANATQVQSSNFIVCAAPGDQIAPVLATDGSGGAIVAWIDDRAGTSAVYAHHVRIGGTLDPAWPAQGLALCTAAGNRTGLGICGDAAGGAFVVWEDDLNGGARVYAQHVPGSGVLDPGWPADGLPICEGLGEQRAPSIDFDGISGAVIAWEDRGRGDNADIFAQHVQRTGRLDWAACGVPVMADARTTVRPTVISDHAGGAIIVYEDSSSYTWPVSRIWAGHIQLTGDLDPAWPPTGLSVAPYGIRGAGTRAISDEAGGAWVANSVDNGINGILNAYHVSLAGEIVGAVWLGSSTPVPHSTLGEATIGPDGLGGVVGASLEFYEYPPGNPIRHHDLIVSCDALVPGQTYRGIRARLPVAIGDGGGGAIVAWLVEPLEMASLYAGHIEASGLTDPVCGPGGKWVSGASASPQLLMVGSGGALLVWQVQGDVTAGWQIAASWLPGPQPTDALASVASAEALWDCVRIVWQCSGRSGSTAAIHRTSDGAEWTEMGVMAPDGQGMVRYEDRAVRPGDRYGYRLGIQASGRETTAAEVWVDVPSLALSLASVRPNPLRTTSETRFTLPQRTPVSLKLFDISGREARTLLKGECDAGEHIVPLAARSTGDRTLPAGLYFLQLDVTGSRLMTRVVVLP